MPLRLQEGSLFIYLAKLTGLSLRSVQFFAFFCNLSTTFHASDSTRRDQLVYFLGFSSALNAFDTQLGLLGCQPVVQRRGPPRNQLLTWHNLWANHANLVFSVPLWNHTTSDAGGGQWSGRREGVSGSSRFKAQVIGTLSKGK